MKVTEHNIDADLTVKEVEALMELVKEQILPMTLKNRFRCSMPRFMAN
jgi:hypothetical protein